MSTKYREGKEVKWLFLIFLPVVWVEMTLILSPGQRWQRSHSDALGHGDLQRHTLKIQYSCKNVLWRFHVWSQKNTLPWILLFYWRNDDTQVCLGEILFQRVIINLQIICYVELGQSLISLQTDNNIIFTEWEDNRESKLSVTCIICRHILCCLVQATLNHAFGW